MSVQPIYVPLINLLSNRLFYIPDYQRAYSWQEEHRTDMFDDIKNLKNEPEDNFHFMATIVGLRRGEKRISTNRYHVIDIVDGQQRITTLALLLKAIERTLPTDDEEARELRKLLVKGDQTSPILLQTNHDRRHYFANYLRSGEFPSVKEAQTLADRELLSAIQECEDFVNNEWDDGIELLGIIKNQLTFIFHEIDREAAVYTVFEVLNNRGLDVSSLDKLKSRLMAVAFEDDQGNSDQHISELHDIWSEIYSTIGVRQDLSAEEVLKFGATLRSPSQTGKLLSEKSAVNHLMKGCQSTSATIDVSNWLLEVTKAYDKFLDHTGSSRKAVNKIVHARLLGLAIILRECSSEEKEELLEQWEKTTFRIFSLCKSDSRLRKPDYVKLAWQTWNEPESNADEIVMTLRGLISGNSVEKAFIEKPNCYRKWEEELRYLLYRYEEHLAEQQGQKLNNEEWNRIWAVSVSRSIEHILPQSKGSRKPLAPGQKGIFVHRLGNLLLLPPGVNSKLGDKDPKEKAECYLQTGLLSVAEVARTIQQDGWGEKQVEEREQQLIEWSQEKWKEDKS